MALPLPRGAAATLAAAALLAPAAAGASSASAASRHANPKLIPSVSTVRPLKLAVGDTLTIRGRNFLVGRAKNTVVFQRTGAKAVFVKAGIATRKLIRVQIPDRLAASLIVRDGVPASTRFRLRVLSARFGRSYTTNRRSPWIAPKAARSHPAPTGPVPIDAIGPDGQAIAPAAACPTVGPATDVDGDGLSEATEQQLGLRSCTYDTDTDGVADGYEYRSARDLNDGLSPNLPSPDKRRYPNPLDGTDAATDFDGDSLTLDEEFRLWTTFGNPAAGLATLNYSDGLQCSIPGLRADAYDKQAAFIAGAGGQAVLDVNHDGNVRSTHAPGDPYLTSETQYFDFDGNGLLCDDERDEDADGLTNYDETHGRLTSSYWPLQYDIEKPFVTSYAGTEFLVADSDGDRVLDGADDQDHDDVSNLAELSRQMATGHDPAPTVSPRPLTSRNPLPSTPDASQPQGRVDPFNPCLPNANSRTCLRHPPFGADAPAPFDGSPDYYVFN